MEESAVEWLVEQMINQMSIRIENTTIGCELFKQANEIFEQQIKDAYQTSHISMMSAEQYYNETFKNK